MAYIKPVLIICDEPIIHKPKPKRINKIQSNMSYFNNGLFSNRQFNQNKMSRRHNHGKINKIKNNQFIIYILLFINFYITNSKFL